MTIVDYFNEVNDKGEPFATRVLNFSVESTSKRTYAAAKTGENSSVDALAMTAEAFDARVPSLGRWELGMIPSYSLYRETMEYFEKNVDMQI